MSLDTALFSDHTSASAITGLHHRPAVAMTKMPSKWGVTLGWRHSPGGYARPGETFMCYFPLAPGSFLQLVRSGPSLGETALYFRSTIGLDVITQLCTGRVSVTSADRGAGVACCSS